MNIYSVYTDEFKPYGKILQNYDTQSLISVMRTIPMPESGTAYQPSISALEESGILDAMQNRAYSGIGLSFFADIGPGEAGTGIRRSAEW